MTTKIRDSGLLAIFLLSAVATGAEAGEAAALDLLGEPWHDERSPVLMRGALISAGTYQYGNPTAAEQAHLERINRARLNPQVEADRLLGGNLNEGITAPDDLISTEPKQPLTFNAQLYQAARLHSQDMIAQDYFDHSSKDGRTPWDRISAAGYTYIAAAENIYISLATYPLNEVNTIVGMHDGFVVDSGVLGRGHRINIFNGNLKEIGIGSANGSFRYEGFDYTYAWTLTCDFGKQSGGNSFVLGVVYDDTNADGEYTAGEGIGAVSVEAVRSADGDTALTATAAAGGYGMPLPAGAYEVSATLIDGRTLQRSVAIDDRNVKVDFKKADFPPPYQCGLQGDVDGSGDVDLVDAVMALQIVVGGQTSVKPCLEASVAASDGKIGLPEAMYAIGIAAGK